MAVPFLVNASISLDSIRNPQGTPLLRKSKASFFFCPRLSVALLALVWGCGTPTEFPVAGQVTLDGEPLQNATVSFLPEDPTSMGAIARTDSEGRYQAEISTERRGLAPGRYAVRVSTYDEGDAETEPPLPPVRERVPRKYNDESSLQIEVFPDRDNRFDFALETK